MEVILKLTEMFHAIGEFCFLAVISELTAVISGITEMFYNVYCYRRVLLPGSDFWTYRNVER
jgi:hypothetical protein